MQEEKRMQAFDRAIPQPELQRPVQQRECPRWSPGTLRSKERRAPVARTSSTWPCRNSGMPPPRPHRNGRHTSWLSPLANRAAQNGELRSQYPQIPAEFVGTVLLFGRGRICVVGAARSFLGRILRNSLLSGHGVLLVFVKANLNFIRHAQIADKLHAVRINEMRLLVSFAINRGWRKIRQLWFAKRKTGRRKKDDQRGCHRSHAVNKPRRLQALQPAPDVAPARRTQCGRQDRVLKLRRRFDRLQCIKTAPPMGQSGHPRPPLSPRYYP